MAHARARQEIWLTLAAALGAIVVLIVAAEVFSFAASRRMQDDVHRLVLDCERSTFLIGDLGQKTSRLHTNLLEAGSGDPAAVEARRERVASITADIESHARELPGLLSGEELEIWASTEPAIEAFTRAATEVFALSEAGRTEEVVAQTTQIADLKRQILDWLGTAMELNQHETQVMLAQTDDLIARARYLGLAVSLLLFLAIAVIALLAVRVLRRKEGELAGYLREIESANSDLEAFAGRVAHDLRDTLAPVNAAGHILLLSSHDPELVTQIGARIERASRRAEELISGMLAFARAGAQPSPEARAELDGALEAVLEELEPAKQRVGAAVELDVQRGLAVRCEHALLHVLLRNLLSNAVKFLDGRPRRAVRIALRASGERCLLEISDTGPGIPRSMQQKVFEPFFRAPGARAGGQGIGLATVRRIVDAHGGEIRVKSREGEGTTFSVTLPLHHDTLAPAPRVERAAGRQRAHT
jgi:two-component system OmpR family sensor kinase